MSENSRRQPGGLVIGQGVRREENRKDRSFKHTGGGAPSFPLDCQHERGCPGVARLRDRCRPPRYRQKHRQTAKLLRKHRSRLTQVHVHPSYRDDHKSRCLVPLIGVGAHAARKTPPLITRNDGRLSAPDGISRSAFSKPDGIKEGAAPSCVTVSAMHQGLNVTV